MPTHDLSSVRPRGASRRPPRHGRRPRRHHVLNAALLALVGVVAFTGTGAALAYNSLQGNIDTHDMDSILGTDRPTQQEPENPDDALAGRPYNVLVMGSDARDGDNADYGQFEGQRSDTTLLVHVSADRSRVDVVSIPRDLLVDIPSCPQPDGSSTWAQDAGSGDNGTRFNSAFSLGGQSGDIAYAAACTILTVENMTGIYIDDFVVVDMSGFKEMVDAIGGVDMCFEEDMRAPRANLDITAGCHTLDGETALAVARARKGVDDGSDISRIGRQQELLTAMVDQVLDKNILTNTPALYQFLQAATGSLTTSENIGNLRTMAGLGYSLRGVAIDEVNFATVPFDWSGNVVLQNADGAALWESIAADQPMVLPPDPDASASPDTAAEADTEGTGSGSDG